MLSGGERARVALARLCVEPGNLLLMDEPTNHLDLESSESLAKSLATFDGALVFVSHNRSLIRSLATKIWNVEDGRVETYAGTLDEYLYSMSLRRRGDDGQAAPAEAEAAAPAVAPEPATSSSRRDGDKARKRREAEARQRRSKVLGPLEKQVADLEARIATLEAEQARRSAQLADPDVYAEAARRNALLGEFQAAQDKLDQLTARWERVASELDEARARFEADDAAAGGDAA